MTSATQSDIYQELDSGDSSETLQATYEPLAAPTNGNHGSGSYRIDDNAERQVSNVDEEYLQVIDDDIQQADGQMRAINIDARPSQLNSDAGRRVADGNSNSSLAADFDSNRSSQLVTEQLYSEIIDVNGVNMEGINSDRSPSLSSRRLVSTADEQKVVEVAANQLRLPRRTTTNRRLLNWSTSIITMKM